MRGSIVVYDTIRIASVAGELRDIRVSGLAKARLLWLFRNFSILDFPVLSTRQQQLITRAWYMEARAGSADADADLIGTIEAFSPRPCPSRIPATRPIRSGPRFALPRGLRVPVWMAMGVLLLGASIYLGASRFMPQPPAAAGPPPQSRVAAVLVPGDVSATDSSMDRVSEEPTTDAQPPADAEPTADARPAALETSGAAAIHLPYAMAHDASPVKTVLAITHDAQPMKVELSRPEPSAGARTGEKPEVIIRVSVDQQGRAGTFRIVQGDREKIPAALHAARLWHFQPCSGSGSCEHLLKFTDYGDASLVRMID